MSADNKEARFKESLVRKHQMISLLLDWANVLENSCLKSKEEARELAVQGKPTDAAGANIIANSVSEMSDTIREVCEGYHQMLIEIYGHVNGHTHE